MHTFAELGNVSRHLVCLTRELATNLYEKWGACYPVVILRWESLFSCWNCLQLGLYPSPVNVWNLKFYLSYLQLLEGSMSWGSKTSSVKAIYFKLSLSYSSAPLWKTGLLRESFAVLIFLNVPPPLFFSIWWIDSVFCCSGCFPAEAEWNRPNCCLFHCSKLKRLHAVFHKFAVGVWLELLKGFPTRGPIDLLSRAAEAVTLSQGSSPGKVSAASLQ